MTTAESIAELTEVIKMGLLLAVPAFWLLLTWWKSSLIAGICAIASAIGVAVPLIDYFGTWIGAVVVISILGVTMLILLEVKAKGVNP